ncbi:MAG: hypothetical protein AAF416_12085 [Pseudomonadota bacterium]
MTLSPELLEGAHNLLVHCGGIKCGDQVLIVHEDPALGWYDEHVAAAVVAAAREIGASPSVVQVEGPEVSLPAAVERALAGSDSIVYLARIGDQDRFAPRRATKPIVMSYARDAEALGSAYGRTDHHALLALKAAIDDLLFGSASIRITCPLGTEITGTVDPALRETAGEVTVRRFPMGVPQPMPAGSFEGRVAIARSLTPTGSRSYEPAALMLDDLAFARIKDGRIAGFDGPSSVTRSIEAHYAHVAGLFGIDAGVVHSWHAGIHPAAAYAGRMEDNPDRWSNTIFTSPRFLHFHTCGAYAPGEICWMVLDPMIALDDRPLWSNGRLCVETFPTLRAVLSEWPGLTALFDCEPASVGL